MPRALDQLILRCLDKDPAAAPADRGRAVEGARRGVARTGRRGRGAAARGGAAGAATGADDGSPRDTLSPPPGRTANDLTIQPARRRGPLVWALAAGAAAAIVVAIVLGARQGGGDKGSLVVVSDAQPPPTTLAAKPLPGRAHVVVKGVEVARVLVDGKLVAAGVREARVLDSGAGGVARPARGGRRSHPARARLHGRRRRRGGAGGLARAAGACRTPQPPASAGRQDTPSRDRGDARDHPDDASPDHVKVPTPRRAGRRRHLRRQVEDDFSASRLASREQRCFDR